ncbi:MAG: hypothetical protein ABUS57_11745 [Pseudomonadota bacterium]
MSDETWIVAEPYSDMTFKRLRRALKDLSYRRIGHSVSHPITQELRTYTVLGPDGVLLIEQDDNMVFRLSVVGPRPLLDELKSAFDEQ